jgi:FkbM family methyltransferase
MNDVRRAVSWLARLVPDKAKRELKEQLGVPSMESTLDRMRRNGFAPRVAIDVGAYSGEWTTLCKDVFPATRVLMIEPQAGRLPDLARVAAAYEGVSLVQTLLGSEPMERVAFYEKETASSVLPEVERNDEPSSYLPMVTLDALLEEQNYERPDLLKLDVQGYELEVLKGGERTLASAEAVLLEVNLIPIHEGAPLLHEVVAYMAERHFRAYDICTLYRRPYDLALWQVDVMFVTTKSPLVASKRWD